MELDEYLRRQRQALRTMNVDKMLQLMQEVGSPTPPTRDMAVVVMHKARVEVTQIEADLRLQSIEWLRAQGYGRMGGLPLPPPGVLPE